MGNVTASLPPDPLSWLRVGCRKDKPPKMSMFTHDALCRLLDGRRTPEDGDGPGTADGSPLHSQKFPGTHFQETNEKPRLLFRHVVYSMFTVHNHKWTLRRRAPLSYPMSRLHQIRFDPALTMNTTRSSKRRHIGEM